MCSTQLQKTGRLDGAKISAVIAEQVISLSQNGLVNWKRIQKNEVGNDKLLASGRKTNCRHS